MATKKRSKGGRAAATRAKAAGGRAVKKATPKKPAARASSAKNRKGKAAKPKVAARPKAVKPKAGAAPKGAAPKRPAALPKPKAVAAKASVAAGSPEVVALKSKFQRERNGLEKRLTEAAREIGMLRHHELRAMHLERQLAERDATIARLQQQLGEAERRPAAESVVYVHEVQQSLALGMPSRGASDGDAVAAELAATALDEFEEPQLVDEGDFVADDDEVLADDGDVRSDD